MSASGKSRYNKQHPAQTQKMLTRSKLVLTLAQGLFHHVRRMSIKFSNVAAIERAVQNLPHLPVPALSQTLEKYLKTVEPFLDDNELKTTKKVIGDFQNGIGPKLQALLVARAQELDSWLADWWLNVAYLEYRDPVVVYSSPGQVFPAEDFDDEEQRLQYTAKLILAALDYKAVIDSGKMPLDMMGKDPLDMNQYNKIFGTCRLPSLKRDYLEFNPQSRHIIVVKNNNFFKLDVINSENQVPNLSELVSCLQSVVEQSQDLGPAIGVLTSDHRDKWARAYQDLILDLNNLRSVRQIQTSLFLVCLDNPMPKMDEHIRTTASKQLIHGGGSEGNSANRWYDKTVQFVVGEDGIVGLTYEHSPSEGQPIAIMTDYLVDYIKKYDFKRSPDEKFDIDATKLEFNVNERIVKAIDDANKNIDKLVDNLDVDSFQFGDFGKEFVKAQKLSPDSFIQMAMQYAFYRLHKVPGAHYESAATRKYIHGRTETIRSCSNESVAFARAMLDTTKSDREKVTALREAINAHKKYSLEAVNGFGVDRHLLGLKLTALENGLEVPPLYKDTSFVRSAHMRISSSQVATKCDGFMVYGPLVADGYGCCYNPRANDINFGVSAFAEHPHTSATNYKQALEASLKDMHDVLARTQTSKL